MVKSDSMRLAIFVLGIIHVLSAALLPASNGSAEGSHLIKRNSIDDRTETHLPLFTMPAYPHTNSLHFGDASKQGKFSDYMSMLYGLGETKRDTIRYRLSGIRGRCGRRVDAIEFRYKDKNPKNLTPIFSPHHGGNGGSPNPLNGGWAEIGVDRGEYVQSVDIRVCHKDSNQICYLAFLSNLGGNTIWSCGEAKDSSLVKSVSSNIIPDNQGKLAYVQGYADDAVRQIQLVWVPGKVFGNPHW